MGRITLLLLLFIPCLVNAQVIDFIIANNPELQELKAINKNIFSLLKVEAKGGSSFGQMQREGTTNIERTQARYEIGITASIPLISPNERAQRRIDEEKKERTMRTELADLLILYKGELINIAEDAKIVNNLYNEVLWMGKRVEAGVDNQKDYNTKLAEYMEKRKTHERKKEQVNYILEKILSYVPVSKREQLKELLHAKKDIP